MTDIREALKTIGDRYAMELSERCDQLELLILECETSGTDGVMDEIYREVHSIKGSAGTSGLVVVSNACHEFENYLEKLNCKDVLDSNGATACLRFLDIIRSVAEAYLADDSETLATAKKELDMLRHGRSCIRTSTSG